MRKSKLVALIMFSSIFLITGSLVIFSGVSFNTATNGCSCHSNDTNISINFLNQTQVNGTPGENIVLAFWVNSTGLSGSNLVVRVEKIEVAPAGTPLVLTFSPQMVEASTGIADGGAGDPDSTVDEQIGSEINPAIVNISNIQDTPATYFITFIAAYGGGVGARAEIQITVGEGGGEKETWQDWFMKTQVPILVGIAICAIVGIILSFIFKVKPAGAAKTKVEGKK